MLNPKNAALDTEEFASKVRRSTSATQQARIPRRRVSTLTNPKTRTARNLREANPPTAETRKRSFSGNLSVTDT
jgi:hypothetical protein